MSAVLSYFYSEFLNRLFVPVGTFTVPRYFGLDHSNGDVRVQQPAVKVLCLNNAGSLVIYKIKYLNLFIICLPHLLMSADLVEYNIPKY